jgi:hypothetical protein
MAIHVKQLASVEIKDETKGEVEAVFATLNVVDRDGDVTKSGAFTNGAEVVISAYGHKSWEGALPVGKGVIEERGDQVVMKGQFFLNTTQGRDHFEVVKELGSRQEWSYGFKVEDSEPGQHEGKSVRILKRMTVHEVSPVMRGAGIGTQTTYAKSFNEEISDAVDAVKVAVESAERVVALRAEKGKELSKVNSESLDGLRDSIKRLETLLDTKQEDDTNEDIEEAQREWLRSIASEL